MDQIIIRIVCFSAIAMLIVAFFALCFYEGGIVLAFFAMMVVGGFWAWLEERNA